MAFTDYEKIARYRRSQKERGLCVCCPQPAAPGRMKCYRHLNAHTKIRKRSRAARIANRQCGGCGSPLVEIMDDGFVSCLNCRMGLYGTVVFNEFAEVRY